MNDALRETYVARRAMLFAKTAYARRIGPALSHWRPGIVVMFHIGRSGSSVLGGMMRRHPRVFWAGEIFRAHLELHGVREEEFSKSQLVGVPPPNIADLSRQSGPLFYGMELKLFHLDIFDIPLDLYLQHLINVGMTQLVILERKNYLAKIVSSVRAHQDGRYHVSNSNTSTDALPAVDLNGGISIDYSTKPLLDHLYAYQEGFSRLRSTTQKLGISPLDLTYEEDIKSDPGRAYEKVCRHLGIRPRAPRPGLRRIGEGNLASQIASASETRFQISGTEFEWMLDE